MDVGERERHWHHHGAERVAVHVERFAAMVRGLDDGQLAATVPGLGWTAREVVAHVATVWRRYTVNRERAATWDGVAEANARDLDAAGDLDVDALLLDIEGHTELLLAAPALVEATALLPFHAGQELTLAGGWGNAINELLVHGDDVARAAGVGWSVDAGDLEPFWRFTSRVLPGFLTPAGRAAAERWTLDLGFGSGPVRLRFDHGAVHVDEPGEWVADHVVAGDPVATTLVMPWRRRPATDPAMARFVELVEAV